MADCTMPHYHIIYPNVWLEGGHTLDEVGRLIMKQVTENSLAGLSSEDTIFTINKIPALLMIDNVKFYWYFQIPGDPVLPDQVKYLICPALFRRLSLAISCYNAHDDDDDEEKDDEEDNEEEDDKEEDDEENNETIIVSSSSSQMSDSGLSDISFDDDDTLMEACLMLEDLDQSLTIDEADFEDDDISYQLEQTAASDQESSTFIQSQSSNFSDSQGQSTFNQSQSFNYSSIQDSSTFIQPQSFNYSSIQGHINIYPTSIIQLLKHSRSINIQSISVIQLH
ncbi:GSCOCG00011353001-RA-CDS [Cotesia congregata]|nr:GSCOCG00011353001-RA-CDS [Cotesia congregata]